MSAEAPRAEAPQWFRDALDTAVEERVISVSGCDIAIRSWGKRELPGLVLVHGGAAHSRWWDHVAPFLAVDHRVVALDLSGHGDSGRRTVYGMASWAAEVNAVARDAEFTGPPVIVGHSMGGWVSMSAACAADSHLTGVVVLDTPFRQRTPEDEAALARKAFGPLRVYPDFEEAVTHFRTIPDQPDSLPYVIDHVARNSLRQVQGGWSWKFDPQMFTRSNPGLELLQSIACRAAVFRSERGLVSADMAAQVYELLGRSAPIVEIPLAGHHVMLDHPLSLVTGLRTLLADWEHSAAYGRNDAL
jgi:pimeloyl-ACP methyl ester carboxylesterase